MTVVPPDGPLLIALDVDGTILNEDGTVGVGAREAVQRAVEQGRHVMLATGRSWSSTKPVMDLFGIEPDFAVCANGATVYRRGEDGEYVRFHTETFDPAPALRLLREHLPQAHYMVEYPDGSRRYTGEMEHWTLDTATPVEFDDLLSPDVTRIVVVSPEHDETDFVDLIAQVGLDQVSYAIGWTAWLDIAPHGVDKGSGLTHVIDALGIDGSRVLTIGDGRNDVGMFAWVRGHGGRAVAMGQAPDEVKQAAGESTADVLNGGVAAVLAQY